MIDVPRHCRVVLAVFSLAVCPLFSQTPAFKMHTEAELQDRGAALMKKASASATGESGEKLDDFGDHWLLLLARTRTGESELHRLWADEIVVRSGELTLIVGGEMTGTHPYNNLPGEYHGSGLIGGETHVLRTGDIAYVPANIPHWMKVESAHPPIVLIYKEKEASR